MSLLDRLWDDLKLAGYSDGSCKAYVRAVRQLQNFWSKPLEALTEEHVREYWRYCKETLKWSPGTFRPSYSGIKFFFAHTLKRDWETLRLVKAERQKTLPTVLSLDEVRAILAALPTPQSRAFFTTVSSLGLRLNEAVHLQVGDIDSARMYVHVHRGKGAKDRLIPLPQTTLDVLRAYWKTHRNRVWLFPAMGQDGRAAPRATRPVSHSAVQDTLRRTIRRLGIRKPVRVHTFRHSYATHMIEAGVPVRHVQQCLGHASLASVMVYLHITHHGREQSRIKLNHLMRGVLS